jgi:hypothetical protein
MATERDLQDDLSVGLTEVRKTLIHYNLAEWEEYLIVRRRGKEGSYIVLAHPSDKSDFQDRLVAFHKAEAEREKGL